MAGLPAKVIERASQVLRTLTTTDDEERLSDHIKQIPLFEKDNDDVIKKIRNLNINSMTPIEALILDKLKNEIK